MTRIDEFLCVMEETNPDLARYMRKVLEDEFGTNPRSGQ
jgi:hypothetical protein